MPKIYILDVCKHIVNLQQEIDGEIASRGGYDANTGTLLGDCRDYCMFYVLDRIVKKTKDVKQIINELNECGAYCNGRGDCLHAGFFFTLSQLLSIKYKVRLLRGDAIDREDFKESWLRTREELRV